MGTILVPVIVSESVSGKGGGSDHHHDALDVLAPLRDPPFFFVDGRRDSHCGEEGVNLVLITTLFEGVDQRHGRARAGSVSECLVGSVTRDLRREEGSHEQRRGRMLAAEMGGNDFHVK